MLKSIIKILFTALAVTIWQMFLQPLWNRWIESQGHTVGFGETLLGWTIALTVAWILASVASRGVDGGGSVK